MISIHNGSGCWVREDGERESITTTDEHPFFADTLDEARQLIRGWTRADRLTPGDVVRTLNGVSLVESVELLEQTATVYTLSVADAQAYLVGLDATWVHNARDCDRELVKSNTHVIREWFGAGISRSQNAGPPPPGMTPEIAHAYIRVLREKLSMRNSGDPADIVNRRIEHIVKWFGDPGTSP